MPQMRVTGNRRKEEGSRRVCYPAEKYNLKGGAFPKEGWEEGNPLDVKRED